MDEKAFCDTLACDRDIWRRYWRPKEELDDQQDHRWQVKGDRSKNYLTF